MSNLPLDQWIKPEVLAQPAYDLKTASCRIKLNQNESPVDWPQELRTAVLERLEAAAWNRYPELIPLRLREKLAASLSVQPEQVVDTSGLNPYLYWLKNLF